MIGFGGSLHPDHPHYDGFLWKKLQDRLTVGHNMSIRHYFPTYWLFTDGPIWTNNTDLVLPEDLPVIIPRRMTPNEFPWKKQAYAMDTCGRWNPKGDDLIFMKSTVATAGLCWAWRLGARKILLLGVDGYAMKDAPYYADGKVLPYDVTRSGSEVSPGIFMEPKRHMEWVQAMAHVHERFKEDGCYAEGLEVFRHTEESRFTMFPHKSLDQFLEEYS